MQVVPVGRVWSVQRRGSVPGPEGVVQSCQGRGAAGEGRWAQPELREHWDTAVSCRGWV